MEAIYKVEEIKKLTNILDVLYVEDEENTRNQIVGILQLFFNKIYVATDGEKGLEVFNKNKIDIVISDIQMPNLNGLDMIERMRKESPELPVIITTAFSEQKYFIKSIDLGVDKYLIKPIEIESAKEVFYTISKMIDDRKKAKEFEFKMIQEKINRISKHIVSQIADSYQSPCIVYTEGKVRYLNDSFCSLFEASESELENLLKNEIIFDKRDGFMSSLTDYDEKDPSNNRVSISKNHGRKIYRVKRNSIMLDENDSQSIIYLFNDITLEEYQKIKIKSYVEMLEDMVFKTHYKAKGKENTPILEDVNQAEEKESLEVVSKIENDQPSDGQKLSIGKNENELLRRSHVNKTTAEVYVQELDNEILKELQELDELDKDFNDSIILLEEDANIEGVKQMAIQLEKYAHEISLLFEFEDLAYAIRSLADMLSSLKETSVDEKKLKKIVIFLSGIQSDLSDWRRLLFIEQSTLDIHYLDSSLFSACLQIELVLSEDVKEMESEDEDLILF